MALSQEHGYLRPNTIPLVEIIEENHKFDNMVDADTGKPIKRRQPCNDAKVRRRAYLTPSPRATLHCRGSRSFFPERVVPIDHFRCDTEKHLHEDAKSREYCDLTGTLTSLATRHWVS